VKDKPAFRGSRASGGIAIGIVGALAALAVMFGNASGTQQTADDALAAQHIGTALGHLATFRGTLGQTLLIAEASPTSEAIPVLVDDASRLAVRLEEDFTVIAEALDKTSLDIDIDPSTVLAASSAMLDALAIGDLITATDRAVVIADELDAVAENLAETRDGLLASVAAAGLQAGRVATAARFMVALGIPGLAMLLWASFARRRRRRARMETALQQEREINRSKDQMIANISHELRTPLTGIYAAALTVSDTGHKDLDLSRELNGVIIEQSIELTRMVDDLLVSAQVGAERLSLAIQEVEIGGAVDSVVSEFARTGTMVESACEPGSVAADPLRLRQILRNLISNARNHGGDRIWVEGEPSPDGYRITVADNGHGVADGIEQRLFTPFVHQGDQPLITGSVGLGLSITRLLAEAMGGRVEYFRDATTTRFLVDLPVPPADPSPTLPNAIVEDPEPVIVAQRVGGSWWEHPVTGAKFNGQRAVLAAGLALPDEEWPATDEAAATRAGLAGAMGRVSDEAETASGR